LIVYRSALVGVYELLEDVLNDDQNMLDRF